MSASERGWGEPGLSRSQITVVPCPGIQLNIRTEVAPLFSELVRWLTAERRRTKVPELSSSGGYNKRYISGTTTWSNHSWGLAADFNAGTNPYAFNATEDMPPDTSQKAASLGMRWGGDYTGRKDGMHFEFIGTPDDAQRLIRSLNSSTPSNIPESDMPLNEDDMAKVRSAVNAMCTEVLRKEGVSGAAAAVGGIAALSALVAAHVANPNLTVEQAKQAAKDGANEAFSERIDSATVTFEHKDQSA